MAVEIKSAHVNQSQIDGVKSYLIKDEILYAVYGCKGHPPGLLGVTDRRLILYNPELGDKTLMSIPFGKIIGVATPDTGAPFESETITVMTAAGNFKFQLNGDGLARWVYNNIMTAVLKSN